MWPPEIPIEGSYVENRELQTLSYLDQIIDWTENQKMEINQKKSKAMLINFTQNHQFISRLTLKGEVIEFVDQMKIFGVIVNNKLSWDENT